MRDIYRRAARVHVWLGENVLDTDGFHDDHAQNAVRSLEYARHVQKDHGIDVPSLVKLFNLPWFQRVWPIQELVVAKAIDMFWGNQEMNWDLLVSAINHLTDASLEGILIAEADGLNALLPSGYINARSTVALRGNFWSGQRNTFWEILMDTMRFQASDPRDKIYALVGLGMYNIGDLIEANYLLPVDRVYCYTTAHLINASSTLFSLSSAGIGYTRSLLTLPSWVPDYSTDPELLPLSTLCSSKDFSACGGRTGHNGSIISICGNILELKGIFIDTVDRVSQPVSRFISLRSEKAYIPD